ncbi:hypothetical protein BDP55DRAFT_731225 [Colletotrichum godetiae]|uniref:Uncharacterized protein n=1 Tax=Colletotrichum godetiae TaxID=1209918 RepID=A0AAJ0AGA3_9PEZI|nr:uncharacterized protein BDP55DRAFT_731225 [Colletotrichum godetiae]KAK1672725.1 hypothetical protein BDP55DRAFT_731225 [Colletotrichum godetiae]
MLKTTADYNFGQTKGGANVGVSSVWFSFNAGASHSSESSTLQLGSEPSQVQVPITHNDLQAITITAGVWNVNVSKDKFRSDSPKEVKSLARVSQIIVIAGLGYEIKVGALTAETLDTKLKQTTSAGGSISVSGIPIGLAEVFHVAGYINQHKSTSLHLQPSLDYSCWSSKWILHLRTSPKL